MPAFDFTRVAARERSRAEKYTLREKLFGTEDVLPMWVADMDIETPECVRRAVAERAQHPVYGYEEMEESAFAAQREWMLRRHGWAMERERLLYSHSVVASISTAVMAFTEPGDEVVVQPPIYPPFVKQVGYNDRRVLSNPLRRDESGRYRFDLDDLERKISPRTKLLLLCSPHNPVGRVWEREELEALAALCLKYGITVFSDEIHSDLVYAPHRHVPFASLSPDVQAATVTAIGPGKTFNVAGLAISTVAISDDTLYRRFEKVYRAIHFAQGTVFGHVGFEAAYREGEAWLEALLGHLRTNRDRLDRLLQRFEGIAMHPPEGTYLAWLDCRGLGFESDRALREFFVREARLGLSPGISFGREGSGFMRLNFAVPTPLMDEAMRRLEQALKGRR